MHLALLPRQVFLTTLLLLVATPALTQPLFKKLPPRQTGVRFTNEIIDRPEHNILIYSNYYGGAGIGIGDFNKDGLQDIFFAGNLVPDELYLNKGDMQFARTQDAGVVEDQGWSSISTMATAPLPKPPGPAV